MIQGNYNGLAKFFEHMNAKIVACEPEKGDSWTFTYIEDLEKNLMGEIEEYKNATTEGEKASELVDIANMCMMLFNRHMDNVARGK